MLPFASLLLLAMAVVMALAVAFASRRLIRRGPAPAGGAGTAGQDRSPGLRARLTRSVERRFPAGGMMGLRLTASVLVALAAFAIFVEVADNVVDQDELSHFDARVMVALAPLRTDVGLAMARGFSFIGSALGLSLLALLLALTIYRRNWRVVAVDWTLVLGGGKLVEQLLKHTFHRTRPAGSGLVSYSYPSGHAMGSMIGFGFLAYLLLLRVRHPAARAAITLAAALLILAVGGSRLVLGVHYFTDVVGGYAAGAVWLTLSITAVEAERGRWHAHAATDVPAPA
jgi:undecaprenyl-diphosphatase